MKAVHLNFFSLKKLSLALSLALIPALRVFAGPVYGPEQALQDFQKGNYQAIDQNVGEVLADKDPNTKCLLARDEKALGRPENMNALRAWLAQNPRSSTAWVALGLVYKAYADVYKDKPAAPGAPTYATLLTSYKTCLDRATTAAPQAAYLWALEIDALQCFSPDPKLMEDYYQNGLRLDRDCALIYEARASYLGHQKTVDWPQIKEFLTSVADRVSPTSHAKLLLVYYHELFGRSDQLVYVDYLNTQEVWDDIVGNLGDWLWTHPDDTEIRSWYARLSCDAQKYPEANKQFKLLNDNAYLYGGWPSKEVYLAKKKEADAHR